MSEPHTSCFRLYQDTSKMACGYTVGKYLFIMLTHFLGCNNVQKAITTYLYSKQLLQFAFSVQYDKVSTSIPL